MCALALACDRRRVGVEIGERAARHYPAEVVDTAPCKEIIVPGDDVDLTMLPLFSHHPLDGQAFINCGRVVTRDPDTGAQNDGIQRQMFRAPNLINIDMRALGHGGSINAHRYNEMGQDTPPLDDAALAERMTAFIAEKPRTWYEILQRFAGQPYRRLYRAFGRLRPKLGRREDLAPGYPYTFADSEFARGDPGSKEP
jgi:hypothetical protein